MFSKEEFLDIVSRDGNRVRFTMPVDFDDLVANFRGIETVNEMVDDFVEDGYLLEDVCYTLEDIEDQTLFILVDAQVNPEFWPQRSTLTTREKEETATRIIAKVKELVGQGHIKSDWSNVHALQQIMKEL